MKKSLFNIGQNVRSVNGFTYGKKGKILEVYDLFYLVDFGYGIITYMKEEELSFSF